jgi:hypothetical protein
MSGVIVNWERIKDTVAGAVEHVGQTAADNRQFVNGVLWGASFRSPLA